MKQKLTVMGEQRLAPPRAEHAPPEKRIDYAKPRSGNRNNRNRRFARAAA